MAEGYQTEDEQIEALKRWWRENGKSTVVTIVIAIVAVLGWRGWEQKQQTEMESASAIYQNLLLATTGNNGTVTAEQQATASHLATTLKADFPGTTYALFAALYKAKFAVDANDLATAEQELHWVLDNKPSAELALQARLRLARVLYGQQKYAQAKVQLSGDNGALSTAFEELKGDILLAEGDSEAAAKAYQKAFELGLGVRGAGPNPLLDMKIQQLKGQQNGTTANTAEQQASSEGEA